MQSDGSPVTPLATPVNSLHPVAPSALNAPTSVTSTPTSGGSPVAALATLVNSLDPIAPSALDAPTSVTGIPTPNTGIPTPAPPLPTTDQNPVPSQTSLEAPGLFLPIPANDFPEVDGLRLDNLLAWIPPKHREIWFSIPGPKCLAYIANDGVVADTFQRVTKLTEVLSTATGNPNIIILPAIPSHFPTDGTKQAFPYLVHGITFTQLESLTKRRLWVTSEIAIFVLPFHRIPVSPYLFTFYRFPRAPDSTSNDLVRDLVRSKILSSFAVHEFLQYYMDNLPPEYDTYPSSLHYILDSIEIEGDLVKLKNNVEIPVYRVYAHPPTITHWLLSRWINILNRLEFTGPDGSASIYVDSPLFCKYCKSVTHFHTKCPYLRLDQWPTFEPFTNEQGRLNGRRGRGRARRACGRGGPCGTSLFQSGFW